LVDIDGVGELIARWDQSSPETRVGRRVVRALDAVAFRPWVTITSDGEVDRLDDIHNPDSPDLFHQYLLHLDEPTAFLRDHWNRAAPFIFAFQIQPLLPGWPRCIPHTYARVNGNADPDVVNRLLFLRTSLEGQYGFQVLACGIDRDSAYSSFHRTFRGQ
jgi:hypothetical protein